MGFYGFQTMFMRALEFWQFFGRGLENDTGWYSKDPGLQLLSVEGKGGAQRKGERKS